MYVETVVSLQEDARVREVLERIVGNMRPLIERLSATERNMRICPMCLCEYVLEAHDEDCAYYDAKEALALLDTLRSR